MEILMIPRDCMTRLRLLIGTFAVSGIALAAAAAVAQESPDTIETFGDQVSVDVVNLEVWVADRQGEPVAGLTADDFELRADGEPVEIRYFAAIGGPQSEDAGPALAQEPAASSEDELLRVVVYVDDWNLRPEDRARVLADLRGFLDRELRSGEDVMVVRHDGTTISIVQELTTDREALARSLDQVERRATPGIALESEHRQARREIERAYRAVEEASEAAPILNIEPCVYGWPDMESAFRTYAAAVAGHAQVSASALATVIQPLGGLPGTKVVLYVGNGLPDQPAADLVEYLRQLCPHRQTEINFFISSYDLNSVYDQVIDRANANRVTLYMIEAEPPVRSPDGEPTDPRFRLSSQAVSLREGSLESGLTRLADETGGRAILDAADFTPALDGIGRDLRHYYSLGFTPAVAGDTEKHRLEVRVEGRSGYRVRYRNSYRGKPFEARMIERVRAVAGLAREQNPLGARIEVGEGFAGTAGRMNVPIRIWTPLDRLVLLPTAEGTEGKLRLMMAVTEEAGATGPVRQTIVPVQVGAAREGETEGPPREKLVEVSLALPPGHHQVAIGLRDELGGEASFLRHDVDVAAVTPAAAPP
jgi:VWFA-related protein